MNYLLYNPLSNNKSDIDFESIYSIFQNEEFTSQDITKTDIKKFISKLNSDDRLIIAGGDGTLSIFANTLDNNIPEIPIFYYATGTGNDFLFDIYGKSDTKYIQINDYLKNLPIATINGEQHRFINGIGFGIDGYCCEEADRLKQLSTKKINYIMIALKGFLKAFKPVTATVTVDGITNVYKNTWLCPTMNGRFYGGGCMIAPTQDRLNRERKLSTVVISHKSRILCLLAFSSVFSGAHTKHENIVKVFVGNNITVSYDRPSPLQIDGETYHNITSYSVRSENLNK